jgi:hypothetical protein
MLALQQTYPSGRAGELCELYVLLARLGKGASLTRGHDLESRRWDANLRSGSG